LREQRSHPLRAADGGVPSHHPAHSGPLHPPPPPLPVRARGPGHAVTDGAALSLRGLTKTYPGAGRAVSDLSLDIAAHELLPVVGPSGCGKSTLLRLVAGLEEASPAQVWIARAPPHHPSPRE